MILAELPFPSGRTFQVVRGDLLKEPVDAIVNAANGRLVHGGGVAGVISRAAGPSLQAECNRIVRERGPLPAGSAVVSGAGRLPFKGVIHAVGPHRGEGDEEQKLVRALGAAFQCAHESGWVALSFPAVSSGIFAVPLQVCARAYDQAVRGWFEGRPKTSLKLIRLCLREQEVIEAVLAELGLRRAG
jgi:O-acetyl-ADP-ribose deacetylase